MKKTIASLIGSSLIIFVSAQKKDDWRHLSETERIVKTLASDDWAGRKPFTEGIDKAAAFIADEFKKAGLQPWDGKSFLQPFTLNIIHFDSAKAFINGESIDEKNIYAHSTVGFLKANQKSLDFDTAYITKTDTFFIKMGRLRKEQKKNLVVFVDTAHQRLFNSSRIFYQQYFSGFKEYNSFYYSDKDAIVILTGKKPENWSVEYQQRIEKKSLQNVVGVLPGKKLKGQQIVFSAHYDHVGIGKPNNENDSIYNGANDDAAGVAAVIQLANHFARQKNNERSLVFAAFTCEEIGYFGSMYFTRHYDSSRIVADFNIEMIGSISENGVGAAGITGYEHSDFGKILQKNLEGSLYQFYPDTLKRMNLFYMSDNITLARKGIPAHTISTSRGSGEPYFHTPDDEWDKLDYKNMNEVIRAIAISAGGIISGKDTPTRIDVNMFRIRN